MSGKRSWWIGLFCFQAVMAVSQTFPAYPEGVALPRNATQLEKDYMANNPLRAYAGEAAPTGLLHCPAEYDPMDGILIAYDGAPGWLDILEEMAAQITTLGNADVYVAADSQSEVNTILTRMTAAGANMARVQTMVVTTDSIWMRDYGPRYVYEGDCRIMVDHTYNRPRPNDNLFPAFFSQFKNHRRYPIPLVHGGGNFHLHATAMAHTTRLINNENPGLSEAEIHDLWSRYQNLDTAFYQPFPTLVDATQHIDMWMQAIADDAVIISDWPMDSGSIQDQICDQTAQSLLDQGLQVYRVPARSVGATHYTYTNVVMCNDIVLVPTYTNSQVSSHNAEAQTVWENALPDKTIVPINCEAIVGAAGVMHCIVMHLPAHLGGTAPTVHFKNEPGGQVYPALDGEEISLDYLVDDDAEVTSIDLMFSTDGGKNFTLLASGLPLQGHSAIATPQVPTTTRGRLRIVAWDAQSNSGFDQHEVDFTINGPRPCPSDCFPNLGDGNYGDGDVNGDDLLAVASYWGDGFGPYDVTPPLGNQVFGDMVVDVRDMVAVVNDLGVCP